MKKFINPTVEIEKFELVDLIATSTNCEWDCGDDTYVCPSNVTGGN